MEEKVVDPSSDAVPVAPAAPVAPMAAGPAAVPPAAPVGVTSDPGIQFVEGTLVAPPRDRRRGAMALGLAALAGLLVYGSGTPPATVATPALSLSVVRGIERPGEAPAGVSPGGPEASAAPAPAPRAPLPAEALKARVRECVKAPIPSADSDLEARFQEMLHIAESLEYHGVNLAPKQEQAFVERFQKVKKLHLLQSTTRQLDELAGAYQVPAPGEKKKIREDIDRLQALAKSIDWVESRYGFQYSKSLKAHLLQTIQILESQEVL